MKEKGCADGYRRKSETTRDKARLGEARWFWTSRHELKDNEDELVDR